MRKGSEAETPEVNDCSIDDLDREIARRDLLEFTRYTFPKFRENWHHKNLCDKLDKFVEKEIRRLIICLPPRHSKSEFASRRLPAYIFGKRPDSHVIS